MLTNKLRAAVIQGFETVVKRRNVYTCLHSLEKSQWLSAAEIQQSQLAGLQLLLAHAQTHCPYYRDLWRTLGLRADTVHQTADLHSWPLVWRDTIRERRNEMRSTDPGIRSIAKATGGSSGTPLAFDVSLESLDRRNAASMRGYGWAGAMPGTRQFYLWGAPLGTRPLRTRWKDFLYYRCLYRRLVVNTFALGKSHASEILARYNAFRAESIVAYTNPLYEFARFIRQNGQSPFRPKSIIVGAEKLHDFQRALIEDVFQAPVFETYGAREFMLIGAECERHDGLHLTQENLLLEILDDDGQPTPPGHEGNVVITDLTNYAMPFIRYVNGDRAMAGLRSCKCGRGLPLLAKVTGRQLDILTAPDGRMISGEFFPHLIKDSPGIERFQVVQERPDSIVLKVVAGKAFGPSEEAALRREIEQATGDSLRFTLERVSDIPLTAVGKHQVVVNKCQANRPRT